MSFAINPLHHADVILRLLADHEERCHARCTSSKYPGCAASTPGPVHRRNSALPSSGDIRKTPPYTTAGTSPSSRSVIDPVVRRHCPSSSIVTVRWPFCGFVSPAEYLPRLPYPRHSLASTSASSFTGSAPQRRVPYLPQTSCPPTPAAITRTSASPARAPPASRSAPSPHPETTPGAAHVYLHRHTQSAGSESRHPARPRDSESDAACQASCAEKSWRLSTFTGTGFALLLSLQVAAESWSSRTHSCQSRR